MEEVRSTLKNMKKRKARISMELWKYGGKEIYIRLLQLSLFNEIWAQGNIPLDWNTFIVIPI